MAEIQEKMVIRVPVTVVDMRDRGNVRCLAGTRPILLDGAFLATSADVVAGPPPTPTDQQTELLATVRELAAKVAALENPPGRRGRSPAAEIAEAPPSS